MAEAVSLERAQELVRERAAQHRPEVEHVELAAALGRRHARDLRADAPWPTTDRSAMDGFGVVTAGGELAAGTELRVVGESLAGHPFAHAVHAGEAIRIMTGAVVPAGVDAVIPVENTSGFAGDTVVLRAPVRSGEHVRRRGSEVAAGQLLLAAGTRIRSAEIGALAVLGQGTVAVYRRPRVAILSTGDEVVDIAQEPAPHQVRDSNSHALAAQVRESGAEPLPLPRARDERDALLSVLRRGLAEADVLLTIGGVSKGTHDLVHGCLCELGVREVFHGVALKPGKPTFFGEHGRGRGFVFGLPGNPASCYTVFDLLVRPLLAALSGAPERSDARLSALVAGVPVRRNRRAQAVPAKLRADGATLAAELSAVQPSGDPFSLLGADGYALIPADVEPPPGTPVVFRRYGDGWPQR